MVTVATFKMRAIIRRKENLQQRSASVHFHRHCLLAGLAVRMTNQSFVFDVEFFDDLGSPGGAAKVGVIPKDHPVIAELPPQNH